MLNEKENTTVVSRENISFYDRIADTYDHLMDRDDNNTIVRQLVAQKFTGCTAKGYILDMGGGTGQDIGWLLANGYKVILCEPSDGMRKIAIDKSRIAGANITLATETDFRRWHKHIFNQPLQGILMNFAVLNCIEDIGLLFEKCALLLSTGNTITALLLHAGFKKMLRRHPVKAAASILLNQTFSYRINQTGNTQRVYLHTLQQLRKSAAPYFNIIHHEPVANYNFMLLQLSRR